MNKSLLRRLRVFSAVVLLIVLVLSARLAWLQIYQYEHYVERAENNRERQLPISAPRGEIFDANGELLAANRAGFAVSILDINLREADFVIEYLSELLDMSEEDIRDKIYNERFRSFAPIRLANNVSPEVVAKIEERRMDLPGVIIETQPVREYVHNSLAAHVLGYVGPISQDQIRAAQAQGIMYRGTDDIGRGGVEATWEQYLRGEEGKLLVETNRYGRRTRVLEQEEPVPGDSIYLTLDSRLQDITERALDDVISGLIEDGHDQAGKGSVVILDPNSGAILAMASYPDYNINTFRADKEEFDALNKDPNEPLYNKAIMGGYPVGSTFKMLPGIAALEEGLINERSTVTCRGSATYFGSATRRCWSVHGTLSIVPAIAKSCNIFFYEMGYRLGTDRLTDYAEDFGFGSSTGLTDLRGEISGLINSRKYRSNYQPGDLLGSAIGQGHIITPLQLANYTAMMANSGIHYRPYLVQQAVSHGGEVTFTAEPEVLNHLDYDESTWDINRRGMEAVTVAGGTAPSMARLPVKVAGKTGTAQTDPDRDLYAHSVFVGYAPADNPEIAFAVLVEYAVDTRRWRSSAAVPIVSQIIEEYYTPEPDPEELQEVEEDTE
ncbi:penicillin-binding protein 2 [Dethiobacter alkaliphilus]|uniref:Penicillin-binding protein 2 n=1 Tax=Dethiobacter alkaliphilus AHT 1 TaxID=555088 RepID=C0GEW1_DETAL|nr:penicillin-binding protein 2 [Dethiobacter alkaliphilus]EEG78143.1 penicillin-binding protein 2 [Dethiobacter alkaliphilus AHT 1]